MSLATDNAARAKPQHSAPSLINEEPWVGHIADHDLLATAYNLPVAGAAFVIGAEATNVINVGIQLSDNDGNDLAVGAVFQAFLSDDSGGDSIASTAPDTSVGVGTDGAIIVEHTTDLAWTLQSEADGAIDLDIEETSTDTWFLVVVLPSGLQIVSAAITFA